MPWRQREPSQDVLEARDRLEAVTRDDERVQHLERRTAKILREDNLAPTIMNALGVRRR
jgi:hypothetical protein